MNKTADKQVAKRYMNMQVCLIAINVNKWVLCIDSIEIRQE